MLISEGQFSQIGENYNIKVTEKSGDNDQYLREVIIHKKDPSRPSGNFTVIIAENGELASAEGSNTLSLILKDGNYYDDIRVKDFKKQSRGPFAKSYFEEYAINIDLTEFNNVDVEKENRLSNQNMYNMRELSQAIDSLSNSFSKDIKVFSDNMYYRSGLAKFYDKKNKDTLVHDTLKSIIRIYPINRQPDIISMALNNVKGTLQSIDAKKSEFTLKTRRLNKFEMALHDKYVLAIACVILFFVGAPLGAIIRKGGMGLPMVIAIVLFLTYHFIGIFAKNSAEDGTLHPFIATWLSTLILLPLGVWLTFRATTDQGIIDLDTFTQRIAKLLKKKKEVIKKTNEVVNNND
jgi:lipopolysaccharide export system permease protein